MKAINVEKTLKSAQSLQVNFGILSKPLIDAVVEIINQQEVINVVLLDKIKEARKEINNLNKYYDNDLYSDNIDPMFKCEDVLKILDSLIESEE